MLRRQHAVTIAAKFLILDSGAVGEMHEQASNDQRLRGKWPVGRNTQ